LPQSPRVRDNLKWQGAVTRTLRTPCRLTGSMTSGHSPPRRASANTVPSRSNRRPTRLELPMESRSRKGAGVMAGAALATASMLVLQAIAMPALVGLWDFSGLGRDPDVPVKSVDVRLDPSTAGDVVARLDREGISSADGLKRFCSWKRDIDVGSAPGGCIYAESGYEIPSVAVFERRGEWLRIALDSSGTRFGWVMSDDAFFHPMTDLLGESRLTYLNTRWNRRLYAAPDAKAIAAGGRVARLSAGSTSAHAEQPYRAVRTVVVGGRLWLRVELLDKVCSANEPRVIDTGWVPAQSSTGEQWAWFWSRGC
jgi:hypothetical protein